MREMPSGRLLAIPHGYPNYVHSVHRLKSLVKAKAVSGLPVALGQPFQQRVDGVPHREKATRTIPIFELQADES